MSLNHGYKYTLLKHDRVFSFLTNHKKLALILISIRGFLAWIIWDLGLFFLLKTECEVFQQGREWMIRAIGAGAIVECGRPRFG